MMTTLFVSLVLAGLGATHCNCCPPQEKPVFACEMNALSAAERAELPKIVDALIDAAPSVKELANGFELSFAKSKGLFSKAAQWMAAESRCCPFFDFSLQVARYGGPMIVRITGPDGVKAFIAEDLPRLHRLTTKSSG